MLGIRYITNISRIFITPTLQHTIFLTRNVRCLHTLSKQNLWQFIRPTTLQFVRHYAKGKDKKKDKGIQKGS